MSTAVQMQPAALDNRDALAKIVEIIGSPKLISEFSTLQSLPATETWSETLEGFYSAYPEYRLQTHNDPETYSVIRGLGALSFFQALGKERLDQVLACSGSKEARQIVLPVYHSIESDYLRQKAIKSHSYGAPLGGNLDDNFIRGALCAAEYLTSFVLPVPSEEFSPSFLVRDLAEMERIVQLLPSDAFRSEATSDDGQYKTTVEWTVGGTVFSLTRFTWGSGWGKDDLVDFALAAQGEKIEQPYPVLEHLYSMVTARAQSSRSTFEKHAKADLCAKVVKALDRLIEVVGARSLEAWLEPLDLTDQIFVGGEIARVDGYRFSLRKGEFTGIFSLSCEATAPFSEKDGFERGVTSVKMEFPHYFISCDQMVYLERDRAVQMVGDKMEQIGRALAELHDRTEQSPAYISTILRELQSASTTEWPVHEGFFFWRRDCGTPEFAASCEVVLPSGSLHIFRVADLSEFDRPVKTMITAYSSGSYSGTPGENSVQMNFVPKGAGPVHYPIGGQDAEKLYQAYHSRVSTEHPDGDFEALLASEMRRRNPIGSLIRGFARKKTCPGMPQGIAGKSPE